VHLPALDGVRAVAVLLVLLFHYELRRWAWYGLIGRPLKYLVDFGWSGVDLFFVLSGFLITGILWSAKERPKYFVNFYARRTLRIFPLYYAFLILIFVVLPAVFGGTGLGPSTPFSTQLWYWTYASNILVSLRGWAAAAPYSSHFWSLAIEEQFYLVWPTVVRHVNRRTAMQLCAAAIVLALALRCWLLLVRGNAPATWVLTPARMDTLAVGALLALAIRSSGGMQAVTRWARPLGAAGFVLVLLLLVTRGTFAYSDPVIGTIGYTIIAFAWAAFLVAALSGGIVSRVMRNSVLQWVGRRSYALYVFHYPIMLALDHDGFTIRTLERLIPSEVGSHLVFLLVNAGLSALAAEASWQLLEKRALRLKDRFA
jgi:peptidoglycan/LPS O-acetylase OafA/YrhL